MYLEMSKISPIKNRLNIRGYHSLIAGAVRTVIGRIAEPSGSDRTKTSREAMLERERHQAESIAQLQFTRFFR
jgi:hypothetical protein